MRPIGESALDTIAALATPAGRSALALIRVSGAGAAQVARRIAPGLPQPPPDRSPRLVSICDEEGEPLDRGLVTFFSAPHTATGEDVMEISIHGNPVLAARLLAAVAASGARPARAGEFTERAFLLGRVDLLEAEAVRDLIEARTETAARLSARRLEGGLSHRLGTVREALVGAAAAVSATVDFAEDVGESVPPQARRQLEDARNELTRLLATYETGRLASEGWRIAILGRPNAGKSTLFNALAGTPRAIVTEIPGTTRDTLEVLLDIAGVPVVLVDTAGLRATSDPVEKIGVERAREAAASASAVLYVYDASRGWSEEDAAAASLADKPVLVFANKIDLAADRLVRPGSIPVCGIAADTGGILRGAIEKTLAPRIATDTTSDVLASVRQRDLVMRARDCTSGALDALARGDSPEYVATHIDGALAALADLAGETTSEDVLRRIFETFCIGK
jgi:tRNA modification GTPase